MSIYFGTTQPDVGDAMRLER